MGEALERAGDMDATGVLALVERARRGDELAFERLIEARLTGLVRLATAIVGNPADARDAVQEGCVNAWRSLPGLRDPERFDAWLSRIVTNACRMTLRGRRRRFVREAPVTTFDDHALPDMVDDATPNPADRSSELDRLTRAFERLDADQRTVIALHYLEGRSVAEIADLLGISVATAKWRLHIARGALATALEVEDR
jgi:RNA polymerase sigma-70 factor (ECF subfamily)